MAWIILEGLDRSGKSSVAEFFQKKGYNVVHMGAPDKKYFRKGYAGSSYLEEMLDLYTKYAGKDIVFDRSSYGELIWPEIFNRQPLLGSEDFEYLQQIEDNNDTTRILMFDENKEAHWQRCVNNQEPLTKQQFMHASRLYEDLANTFNFQRKQLHDFFDIQRTSENNTSADISANAKPNMRDDGFVGNLRQPQQRGNSEDAQFSSVVHNQLDKKIERANAIKDLLNSTIVKRKGPAYADIEKDIRQFLEQQLENIFKEPKKNDFTEEEIKILKVYAQRIKEKLG